MAYIYLLDHKISKESLIPRLKNDTRIDVIAWKDNGGVLFVKPNGKFIDLYNQSWHIEGDE